MVRSPPGGAGSPDARHRAATGLLLRVNQVGYATGRPKIAYLMAPAPIAEPTFHVVDGDGGSVLAAPAGAARMWSAAFPAVYPLDFSTVDTRRQLPHRSRATPTCRITIGAGCGRLRPAG